SPPEGTGLRPRGARRSSKKLTLFLRARLMLPKLILVELDYNNLFRVIHNVLFYSFLKYKKAA
ncbi:hypothetical protein, partial [Bacillus sp. FJAT-27445]|uniref:hypothetical protein n=1 Tax=Bacillus sp. FJAT-27445 TaxID=1679166 RepID=UPI001C129F32